MFISGAEALETIAKGGAWNWCFIGPDPVILPLVGGGQDGFDEMVRCYEETMRDDTFGNIYGLIRLDFDTQTRFVSIRATKDGLGTDMLISKRASNISLIKKGQQQALSGSMEKAFTEHTGKIHASVQVCCLEEFVWDDVLDKLTRATPQSVEIMTRDVYEDTLAELKAKHIENGLRRKSTRLARSTTRQDREAKIANIMRCETAPATDAAEDLQQECVATSRSNEKDTPPDQSEAAMGSPGNKAEDVAEKEAEPADVPPTDASEVDPEDLCAEKEVNAEATKEEGTGEQKEPIKWEKGQPVIAYFTAQRRWINDGMIVDVLTEDRLDGDMLYPVGAVKVKYNKNKNFRWLLPKNIDSFIRASNRPRAPISLSGELYKETHGRLYRKHIRFCGLTEGYLQWWSTHEEAKSGARRQGQVCLLGMEVKTQGTQFWIRTAATKGLVYGFDATTPEVLDAWLAGFKCHAKYARAIQEYLVEEEHKTASAVAD